MAIAPDPSAEKRGILRHGYKVSGKRAAEIMADPEKLAGLQARIDKARDESSNDPGLTRDQFIEEFLTEDTQSQ